MTKPLTLLLPEHIYEPIRKRADQLGQTPEQVISEWVEETVKRLIHEDPLLQLAGVFESDFTDVAEHHDQYIGEGLMNSNE